MVYLAFHIILKFECLENNPDQRLHNEPNLGASANIVVRLARIIPKNQNYKLYFDNYYTTLALEVYLKKMVYTFWAHYEEIEFPALFYQMKNV